MANNKLIVQHRRGTAEQWESSGIVPYDGEIVVHECADGTFKTKIGDGVNTFPNLPYQNLDKEIAELKQYVDGKGSTYAAYTSKNKRIKYNSTGESYVNYWTRSADIGSVNNFHCVYNNGAISSFGADFPMGVAFGFCI